MRLWSIHPKYLDPQGLVALWREGLLAQAVLLNQTKGYKNHPQLERFKKTRCPCATMATYLRAVLKEASRRGYNFDGSKIQGGSVTVRVAVTKGQLDYELTHLKKKLWNRNKQFYKNISDLRVSDAHPIFRVIEGKIETWERV